MTGRRARGLRAGLGVAAMTLLVAGCTGSDDDSAEREPSAPKSAPVLATDAAPGQVTGKLPRAAREAATTEVAGVVDAWFEAAYLGEYPRSEFAYPGFTKRLAARAGKDAALTSNAAIGEQITSATATHRKVRVDLFAARGEVVGATARFRLTFAVDGDQTGTATVRGRLTLTPTKSGWSVFEYQVSRHGKGTV